MPGPNRLNWQQLLNEALNQKGSVTDIYSRFYEYSIGNCILLRIQGANEPVNTLKRWNAMNRRVIAGSTAYSIMVPMISRRRDDDGEEQRLLRGFRLSKCLFTVSQTEGEELPPPQPREWSKERALGKLAIREVPFDLLESNTQGFSRGRDLSVSPVADSPMKTWLHEAAHIVAGHTSEKGMREYRRHRGLCELEAEGAAYILLNELGMAERGDLEDSGFYIWHWIGDGQAPEASIRRIFTTADAILKAGRLTIST
jgi:hypothetical protein